MAWVEKDRNNNLVSTPSFTFTRTWFLFPAERLLLVWGTWNRVVLVLAVTLLLITRLGSTGWGSCVSPGFIFVHLLHLPYLPPTLRMHPPARIFTFSFLFLLFLPMITYFQVCLLFLPDCKPMVFPSEQSMCSSTAWDQPPVWWSCFMSLY